MSGVFLLRFVVQFTFYDTSFVHPVRHRNAQHTKAILHATAEVDTAGFFKIFSRACNLPYLVAIHEYLRYHLIIENKIIAVVCEVDRTDNLCAECTITCMVFAQLLPQHNVLEQCKATVEDVFIHRHTPLQRTFTKYAATK